MFKQRKMTTFSLAMLLSGCKGRLTDAINCVRSEYCGDSSDNTIDGNASNNRIIGFSGKDLLNGLGGDDYILGYDGEDNLFGGEGDDYIDGGSGDDTLNGDTGNDSLHGGAGNDLIDGGNGRDVLYGGTGNDTVVFMLEDIFADGGPGADTLIFNDNITKLDIIFDFEKGKGALQSILNQSTTNIMNFEHFRTSSTNKLFVTDKIEMLSIETGSGADVVHSISLNISIETGAGNDVVVKKAGSGTISTGTGNDEVELNTSDATIVELGDGDDTVTIQSLFGRIDGGDGTDTLILSEMWFYPELIFTLLGSAVYSNTPGLIPAGYDLILLNLENILYEGEIDVTLYGDSSSNQLTSGFGSDQLDGGEGNDLLISGAGKDMLLGGRGADTLTGGPGEDLFVFKTGDSGITLPTADTIEDFTTNVDTITFEGPSGSATNFHIERNNNAVDFDAALANVNDGIFDGAVIYAFQTNGMDGWLFHDNDADNDADEVIVLSGIDGNLISPGDII